MGEDVHKIQSNETHEITHSGQLIRSTHSWLVPQPGVNEPLKKSSYHADTCIIKNRLNRLIALISLQTDYRITQIALKTDFFIQNIYFFILKITPKIAISYNQMHSKVHKSTVKILSKITFKIISKYTQYALEL